MDREEVIICRCEDITLKEIEELLLAGYSTIQEIKGVSRCGMGPCQGRTCNPLLVNILAKYHGVDPSQIKLPTQRPPIKPIRMGTIVEAFTLDSAQEMGDLLEEKS